MNATPTLYGWAGGKAAIRRLMDYFYDRVERDELLSPYFPGGVSEEHRAHVAAWWSEVLGGPAHYTGDWAATRRCSPTIAASRSRPRRGMGSSRCSASPPTTPAFPTIRSSVDGAFSLSFERAFGETPHQYLGRRGTGARGGARELSNNDRSKEER